MTKKLPVLDDATRDAHVIGYAATVEEAAEVFKGYMAERMEPEDFAEMVTPAFYLRGVESLSPELRDECRSGAFEPSPA